MQKSSYESKTVFSNLEGNTTEPFQAQLQEKNDGTHQYCSYRIEKNKEM
jgi:hypothetical protein